MKYKTLISLKTKEYKHHIQEDNFLYHFKDKNIYIMDNHRLSLWCWINEIDKKDYNKYTFVQIDDHFDCGATKGRVLRMMSDLKKNGVSYYKNLDHFRFNETDEKIQDGTDDNYKIFSYGSYLIPAIYLKIFNENKLNFFTKNDITHYTRGGINDECAMNGNAPEINHFQKSNKDDPDNSGEGLRKLEVILGNEKNIIFNNVFSTIHKYLECK
ncbi:hypothetical protein KAJ41_02620 [Candidatus Parcubacteria bacterium]|nr:hypothetical protein [Candidatus Parcubacteria bacterium]